MLAGLVAAILAIGGRPHLAAVALGVALMAKPQALAFVPPFAPGPIGPLRLAVGATAGVVVAGTVVVLWLPFVADGGPMAYLTTLGRHQTQVFPIMSLRAWNPWWVFQTLIAGDDFVADGGALIGPLSPRLTRLPVRRAARDRRDAGRLAGADEARAARSAWPRRRSSCSGS